LNLKSWLAFIGLGVIWGSSFLWIKIALQEIGPFLLVSLRILFGIITLLIVVSIQKPRWPWSRRVWLNLLFLGLINNASPYLLISWGELHIDSAVAAILNSTVPLFTMVIAHAFLSDDRMTRARFLALGLGFAGIFVLLSRDLKSGFQVGLLGQAAVLLASLSYAVSSVFARRTTRELPSPLPALIPLFSADAVMWAVTPLAESPLRLPGSAITWVAVLWLGVLGVAIAYLLYFYLLHTVGPTRTMLVTYVFPLVGIALGVIFLNELLDWHLILGAMMVVGSIVLVNRGR
jgi:drug/metabolite transporter (DMT)-like permease